MKFRNVLLALSLLLVCSAGLARAAKKPKEDTTTRSVQGSVKNAADEPVEGAVVQLKDTKTLNIRSFFTKPDGTYSFAGLNKNTDYELKAVYRDAASDNKTLSVFDDRKLAIINLKLKK